MTRDEDSYGNGDVIDESSNDSYGLREQTSVPFEPKAGDHLLGDFGDALALHVHPETHLRTRTRKRSECRGPFVWRLSCRLGVGLTA